VQLEIDAICSQCWVARSVITTLTVTSPAWLRPEYPIDEAAQLAMDTQQPRENKLFGKHLLFADHEDWTIPQIVAAYRWLPPDKGSFGHLIQTPCSTGPIKDPRPRLLLSARAARRSPHGALGLGERSKPADERTRAPQRDRRDRPPLCRRARAAAGVHGHEKVRTYGHERSALMATKSPQFWPPKVRTPH
jgi:hypothetical protein